MVYSIARVLEEGLDGLRARELAPVDVAVLDSGIDATHPDLAGRVITARAACIVDGTVAVTEQVVPANHDAFGHGTAVGSVIAGLARNAKLGDYRVLGSDNCGTGDALVAALRHALDAGYPIVNMSLAARAELAPKLRPLCDRAYRNGQVIVAAARNMPLVDFGYPAELTSVISVDRARFATPLALRYVPRNIIEFVGHGDDVIVAAAGGGHTTKNGTSIAAPAVSAIVALLLGAYPELRPFEVKSVLCAWSES
jgi:subtilisin family serine protease